MNKIKYGMVLTCMIFCSFAMGVKLQAKSIKMLTVEVGHSFKIAPAKSKIDVQKKDKTSLRKLGSGKIKAKKTGKFQVVVTKKNKEVVKYKVSVIRSCKRIIIENPPSRIGLLPQKNYDLKWGIYPQTTTQKKVIWSSSNTQVAIVNKKGKIRTMTEGTTVITAMSTENENVFATFTLTVQKPINSLSNISSFENMYLIKGMKRRLPISIHPYTATNTKLLWTSSNEKAVRVDEVGRIETCGSGESEITATTTDGSNLSTSYHIYVISMSDVNFIAHGGLSSLAPFDSIAAFNLAGKNGYYGVECDIWETKDNEFAVSHDDSLRSYCGVNMKISESPLSEIVKQTIKKGEGLKEYPNEHIPSLQQYLEVIKKYSKMSAIIEIKSPKLSDESMTKLIKQIKDNKLEKRIKLISFQQKLIEQIKRIDQSINCQFLCYYYSDNLANWCKKNNVEISMYWTNYRMLSEDIRINSKVKIGVWTIDSLPDIYEYIKDWKPAYITTGQLIG